MNKNNKVFIKHIAWLLVNTKIFIHLFQIAQIALLIADETFVIMCIKYFDYTNIFLPKSIAELPKYTRINDYLIKLINN